MRRGRIMSKGQSQPRTQSLRRNLGKRKESGNSDHIVVIDIDQIKSKKVVFIDVSETSHQIYGGYKSSRANKRGSNRRLIISIDDEAEVGDLDSDASSSKTFCPTTKCQSHASDEPDEDCQIFEQERSIPFELSKCKRRRVGNGAHGNHFGINTDSKSTLSESNCSDCEILEGSSGKVREEWEKAALRRKFVEDQTSASGPNFVDINHSYEPNHKHFSGKDNRNSLNSGASIQSSSSDASGKTKSPYTCMEDSSSKPDGIPSVEDSVGQVGGKQQCAQDAYVPAERWNVEESYNQYTSISNSEKPAQEESSTYHDIEKPDSHTRVNLRRACVEEVLFSGAGIDQEGSTFQEKEVVVCGAESFVNDEKHDHTDVIAGKMQTLLSIPLPQNETPEKVLMLLKGNVDPISNNLIGEREKHKETEEYKRASEEEWAARQQQLQMQAEEAKRLRKRKKAEVLRLMDMEKRQKQRVEEMRETQKKDEETNNLKEQLRMEVRKELGNLEVKYRDMASLLRGLGVNVAGGPNPISREVHAAYKQALLRFHPDRASRSGIRQQIEAEETFKLISRLKEKLLPTT